MMCFAAADHDPTHFGDDAENFRVDRSEAELHLAFGKGAHLCLGGRARPTRDADHAGVADHDDAPDGTGPGSGAAVQPECAVPQPAVPARGAPAPSGHDRAGGRRSEVPAGAACAEDLCAPGLSVRRRQLQQLFLLTSSRTANSHSAGTRSCRSSWGPIGGVITGRWRIRERHEAAGALHDLLGLRPTDDAHPLAAGRRARRHDAGGSPTRWRRVGRLRSRRPRARPAGR